MPSSAKNDEPGELSPNVFTSPEGNEPPTETADVVSDESPQNDEPNVLETVDLSDESFHSVVNNTATENISPFNETDAPEDEKISEKSNIPMESEKLEDSVLPTNDPESDTSPVAAPPALPPRGLNILPIGNTISEPTPPPLPPRKRAPFFWMKRRSQFTASDESDRIYSNNSRSISTASYDLLLHRIDAVRQGISTKGDADQKDLVSGTKQLQEDFREARQNYRRGSYYEERNGESSPSDIDWEFWSDVISDYANVARNRPRELSSAIASGFPSEVRGLIWQVIASSKSSSLEELYREILKESSPHEKAIRRDLSRTSFVKSADHESLFRIIKAYSLFDPDVGYTQGMAFIAAPILINMEEAEAFCLLVRLMKDYDFRSLFSPNMPGLHLRLFQFDRMLEDMLPPVHVHLSRQGVRSSMYASQWFLTLFAYKFPLSIVLRIYDVVIAEGIEAILKFGFALLRKNADTILNLQFDALLSFLKEKIFDYLIDPQGQYQVNDLVFDAYEVNLLPITLKRYEDEYEEIHRIERERVAETENLRSANGQLTLQLRRLESSLSQLNKEHIEVANEMVQGKLKIARLEDENADLKEELANYREISKDGEAEDTDIRAEVSVKYDVGLRTVLIFIVAEVEARK